MCWVYVRFESNDIAAMLIFSFWSETKFRPYYCNSVLPDPLLWLLCHHVIRRTSASLILDVKSFGIDSDIWRKIRQYSAPRSEVSGMWSLNKSYWLLPSHHSCSWYVWHFIHFRNYATDLILHMALHMYAFSLCSSLSFSLRRPRYHVDFA